MTDTSRDPEAEADSFDPSRGGYNVTWERYCALLTRAEELEAAKWKQQHTDTMNDIVQMGIARDEAIRRAEIANARLAEAVEWLEAWMELASYCAIEEGVCCCGDDMESHANPMDCGHSPVDHGAHIAMQLEESTRTTLAKIKGETDDE